MPDFVWLADAMTRWPRLPELQGTWQAGCHRRLWDALTLCEQTPDRVGPSDLATLVRHVLRREQVRERTSPTLELPSSYPWPDRPQWESVGCSVTELPAGRRLITAQPWHPSWLQGAERKSPENDAFGEEPRRTSTPLPGDGFLSVVGFEQYTAPGQRQALRCVLASAPGATILVNLPTGTGKSAVAHIPAILWGSPAGLSVVVVPTTALALDQERAVQSYQTRIDGLSGHLAYHSDLSAQDREAVRAAIRDGSQRILFASPESLTGALAPALFHAARSGFLRLLVVDEAHIVSQWGAEFRPEFQAIAGIRRALLRAAVASGADAFRTLLLTATLTEDSFDALRTLFGDPGPFEHISAVTLRPEPAYWFARCSSEGERRLRLVEAVGRLPKPLVLYVGTTQQVSDYAELLRGSGFCRVATVLGETSPSDRLRVIREWRGESLDARGVARTNVDVVVATSAFGLGIDQADVRAVIHACIPETIDRFYQEVGRGGRDGSACMSLLLWTQDDKGVARNLNQRRIIGTEKGFAHWIAMLGTSEVIDGPKNIRRVALDSRPPYLYADTNENRAWNLRTLALMSRAGLLELDAESPPTRMSEETEEEWDGRCAEAFARYRNRSVIRLLDLGAGDVQVWDARCRAAKMQNQAFDRAQHDAMLGLLNGEPPVCEILQRAYLVERQPTEHSTEVRITAERSCGGCPACRRRGSQPWEGARPNPPPIRHCFTSLSPSLQRLMGGASLLWAFAPSHWDEGIWFREVVRLVERAVRHGIRNIVGQPEVLNHGTVRDCFRYTRARFVFLHSFDEDFGMPELPTLWLQPIGSRSRVPVGVLGRGSPDRPWIVVAGEKAPDPEHLTAFASQLRTPRLPLDKLILRL